MPGLTIEERRFRDENPAKVLKCETKLIRLNQTRAWDEFYEALTVYKEQHEDCEVPQRYAAVLRLGAWVNIQRRDREKLSSGQRKRLDELGFD
jgi:hypothetical protein